MPYALELLIIGLASVVAAMIISMLIIHLKHEKNRRDNNRYHSILH